MPIYIRDQGQLAQLSNPAYKGEGGKAGAVPNLQIGSISTSVDQQAIVSISGDEENPVIDFVIPAGDQGGRGLFVGKPDNAPIDAKVVIDNKSSSPHDLFLKDSTIDYMGEEHISLKEKGDSDVEYMLRKFGTQHYEGSNITATSTCAMQVKSAMFKGRTLYKISDLTQNHFVLFYSFLIGKYLNVKDGTWLNGSPTHLYNEEYYFIPSGTQSITLKGENNYKKICFYDGNKKFISGHSHNVVEYVDLKKEVPSNAQYFRFNTSKTIGVPLPPNDYLEVYLDDKLHLTNKNVIQELVSCKTPSLVSVGKNLFDKDSLIKPSKWNSIWSEKLNKNDFNLKRGKTYYFNIPHRVRWFKNNSIVTEKHFSVKKAITVPLDFDNVVFDIYIPEMTLEEYSAKLESSYIIQGAQETFHEPYKSHALTTPQDLELRGIGSVQDTFDLITGEKIERIGEIVLDGSEDWIADNVGLSTRKNFSAFIRVADKKYADGSGPNYSYIDNLTMNDRLPNGAYDFLTGKQGDNEGASGKIENRYLVSISKSKLETQDLKGFKLWLSKNPITVQYELKTPNKKPPIDLNNQKVYSYDGTTHYTTSSLQGHLNPILSIDVPTNITSLIRYQQNIINQQRLILSEREEMQNILIDSTLNRYEQVLLTATHISEEKIPNYIQKLYEVAYKRGIRTKEGEL